MALLIRALLVLFAGLSAAHAGCRVLDAELAAHYEGACEGGLAHGHGHARGIADYTGEFRAGKKHGEGTQTWNNGDRYTGHFADDQKHGYGRYLWGEKSLEPGARYEGHYQNDQRHGEGTYTLPGGLTLTTRWMHDQPLGPFSPAWIHFAKRQAEIQAALAAPGTRVCRAITLGHGAQDWLRGDVLPSATGEFAVRITDAGQLPHVLGDQRVQIGAILTGSPRDWTPCTREPAQSPDRMRSR